MEEHVISRREALKLAKLGLLLGTGLSLGTLVEAGAQGEATGRTARRYTIKWYRQSGAKSELVAFAASPIDLEHVLSTQRVQCMMKYYRQSSTGSPEVLATFSAYLKMADIR